MTSTSASRTPRSRRAWRWRPFTVVALLLPALAVAMPVAPADFCNKYPTAPVCVGGQPACTYCHTSPPTRNAFGAAVEANLLPGTARPLSNDQYTAGLPAALSAVESLDSDGDGVSNLVEIQKGTFPGDASSFPADIACVGPTNPTYAVCSYDYRYVYRKVKLDFCGFSPTYEELEALKPLSTADQAQKIDDLLTACLKSELWRGKNGQLWELAHRKIRPVGSLKAGPEDQGVVPLADYYDDYNLFAWSQTDDHDARAVLTADFYVSRATNPTVYTQTQTLPIQAVDQTHRAGNMTTAWSLADFVMFTALPRNAAAQAYRGYLGLDIAKQEGLYPIPGEPKDYDRKGVTQDLCTQCHATLDPLSYPFRNFNGLTGNSNQLGRYVPNRLETIEPFKDQAFLATIPEQGYIFGKPVSDLKAWASTAANSDQFARATVLDYWKLLMGGLPTSDQNDEFVQLWQRLETVNNYSVDKMLHELVRTEAYGAP